MERTLNMLTDDAVAALPLSRGRAELLEEIISSRARDDTSSHGPRTPRTVDRWLVPLVAAAVVLGLAAIPVWAGSQGPGGPAATGTSNRADSPDTAYGVVLGAPGWKVEHADAGEDGGAASYRNGHAVLEITRAPASLYADYVKDREHIVDPPAPGVPVEVLGLPAQVWDYNSVNHTAIRAPQSGTWLEFRGIHLSQATFLTLLGRLHLVDKADFQAALPDRFVTDDEREAVVSKMVHGIATAIGPHLGLTPLPTEPGTFDLLAVERNVLGDDVVSTVACAWLDSYTEGRASGDTARVADAVAAMATARRWPILREMDPVSDYPEVVWEYADDVAAGRDVSGFPGVLGCR